MQSQYITGTRYPDIIVPFFVFKFQDTNIDDMRFQQNCATILYITSDD